MFKRARLRSTGAKMVDSMNLARTQGWVSDGDMMDWSKAICEGQVILSIYKYDGHSPNWHLRIAVPKWPGEGGMKRSHYLGMYPSFEKAMDAAIKAQKEYEK